MKPLQIRLKLAKYAALTASFFISAQAFAGGPPGTITHAPFSSSVPMLGGAGLIVLAALLGLVSLRFLKDRNAGKFFTLAIVAGALAAGGSGVKLISDANAISIPQISLTQESGGVVSILEEGFSDVRNTSIVTQEIIEISLAPGCQLLPLSAGINGGVINGGNGGTFRGMCNDSPGTILQPADSCEVNVCCTPVNGGCFFPD